MNHLIFIYSYRAIGINFLYTSCHQPRGAGFTSSNYPLGELVAERWLCRHRPAASLVSKAGRVGVGTERGCCRNARRSDHERKAKQCGARAGTAVSAGSFFHELREEAKPAALSFLLRFSSLRREPFLAHPWVGGARGVLLWGQLRLGFCLGCSCLEVLVVFVCSRV